MKKKFVIILLALAAIAVGAVFYFSGSMAPGAAKKPGGNAAVPVRETRKIILYYYNSEIDKDANGNARCGRGGLGQTSREIPATETPIQDAINLLIKGELTDNEKRAGLTTEFPLPGLALKTANLDAGVLTLEFNDPQNRTGGGACRAGVLWYQIEATAKQFPQVGSVRFLPETLFQP